MPEPEALASRSETFPPLKSRTAACCWTCGADVQADRIEAEVCAWGAGFTSWSVAYIVLMGSPEEPHVWGAIRLAALCEFKHETGMPLPGFPAPLLIVGTAQPMY